MSLSRRDFVRILAAASAAPLAGRLAFAAPPGAARSAERVRLDPDGVIRWKADGREVALFGANYCLPSSCDYRAAGRAGADRKALIRQDMAHFARMGWDALRLSFWGDWENSDAQGNLVANDHLDLLHYLVAEASSRGISMLLSPIVTYSSLWPDLTDDPAVQGFSRHFEKSALGTDPAAIAAQCRYLQQLLRHVSPYTGRALGDEPDILFIEMINEPYHHSDDFAGSVRYINALVDAVRSTGCGKILFHNLSQDFAMARPIAASKAQGGTIAWYPSGLDMRGQLHGNFLRYIDGYPAMPPQMARKAKIVYEFDMPDVMSGYHYPAMVRELRGVGAQSATMFSYDELATAPYNGSWQVHCLNLVYTPQKAASAIIAAEAMRRLPRGRDYGAYPQNTRFGDFRVSYEEDLAEMVTPTEFLHSNDTASRPPSPGALRRIVGYGSSPVVQYGGHGLYFLDKIRDGVWRLEVYPDATQVADPFLAPRVGRTAFRLSAAERPMTVTLPDLGGAFRVAPLDAGNSHAVRAAGGRFTVSPGVFLLTSASRKSPGTLPDRVGRVGLREFVCPPADKAAPTAPVVAPAESPPALFDPAKDMEKLDRSREYWNTPAGRERPASGETPALRLSVPPDRDRGPEDVTVSLYVGDRVTVRARGAGAVLLAAATDAGEAVLHVTLVEKDGTAWGAPVTVTATGTPVRFPLSGLAPVAWVLLPQGYPGDWSYWAPPTRRGGRVDIRQVERLQLSVRRADAGTSPAREIVVRGVALV